MSSNKTYLCFSCWPLCEDTRLFSSAGTDELLACASWLLSFPLSDKMLWCEHERELGNGGRRRKQAQKHESRRRENVQQLKSYLVFFLLLVSQQILACARPSPVQVTPPASRPDRADTCASVLGATWGKTASWSQDSASQTGTSFYVEHNIRSFLIIIVSISDRCRERDCWEEIGLDVSLLAHAGAGVVFVCDRHIQLSENIIWKIHPLLWYKGVDFSLFLPSD